MSSLVRNHFAARLLAFFTCLLLLSACASNDQPAKPKKVGMHIDAELEFTIAYPLDWRKERRVPWRKTAGSVVWFLPGPATAGTFEVTSTPIDAMGRPTASPFALVHSRYPGLTDIVQEQVELPAGRAQHLTGNTAQASVTAFLLSATTRNYLLVFAVKPQLQEDYSPVAEEVFNSFRLLGAEP